jgi:AmmeMemoRadiSam system protein B
MLRQAAVAGYFYQATPSRLRDQVERFLVHEKNKIRARGVVVPHAGFVYSGSVAGAVYSRIELPGTVILIGPNHTGLGAPVSIMADGQWMTPLGTVSVDAKLAAAVKFRSRRVQDDTVAHLREHSLEVQLPFLQHLREDVRIVPIQMLDTRLETCVDLGNAVAGAIREWEQGSADAGPGVLIVASSDMSHYVSANEAKERDHLALDRILALDPQGLHTVVRDEHITMCGFGPVVAMLTACKVLGAAKAKLIKYANSGEVSGDFEQVVGYAGVVVF